MVEKTQISARILSGVCVCWGKGGAQWYFIQKREQNTLPESREYQSIHKIVIKHR